MKTIFILLFFVPIWCFGQKDYCKHIFRSVDEKGTTLKSPDLKYLSVLKQTKITTFFALHLHFSDLNQHFEATGAAIEFEDGSIIKDENTTVNCQQEKGELKSGYGSGSSFAHSGEYVIQGFFTINDDNIEKLVSKKIIRIQLDKASKKISDKDAVKVMNYIKCLQGGK